MEMVPKESKSVMYTAVDIETGGLRFYKDRIFGVGQGEIYREGVHQVSGPATAQNGRFEYKFLKQNNISFDWKFDTLLAASILLDRPESLKLDSLAQHYLNMSSWKDETTKLMKKKNWAEIHDTQPEVRRLLAERNVLDLKATSALTDILINRLENEGMTEFFFEKLMPAARLLADVEYRGMRIDLGATRQKLIDTSQKLVDIKARLDAWSNPTIINWSSPKQLLTFLRGLGYNMWIYDFKTKSTIESTGVDALEKLLPNPKIELLLEYRKTLKLLGYLEGWLEEQHNERLFPSYNLASTRTGRLSCSDPNLQQVPRDKTVRALFIPSPDKVYVIADYAQVEPRVAAHYSGDEALLNVFRDNLDFYGSIAVNVLGAPCKPNEVKALYPDTRKVAKEVGLSILYGIGAMKLGTLIKKKASIVFDEAQCRAIIKDYFKAYPGLLEFRKYVEKKVLAGEPLKTHYGRQFLINPDKVFSTGTNTIIQSTASDACLFSQLTIEEKLKEMNIEAPLVALVHDEIIRECAPEHAQTVGALMENVMTNQGFICPLKLDWAVGTSWGDKT